MSLKHFLGETPEIRIVDFLIENMDMEYSIDEIAICTTLSTKEVSDAMRTLLNNEVIGEIASGKYQGCYTLKDNNIAKLLIDVVYTHSFTMAEKKEV